MQIRVKSQNFQEVVDITSQIEKVVSESDVEEGICHVFITHATAALVINENADPNIGKDLLLALNKAFPDHAGYLHDQIDNNAGAHIKAAVLGPSESIPIAKNRLQLGTWQSIMLVELDGPKSRNIEVKVSSSM